MKIHERSAGNLFCPLRAIVKAVHLVSKEFDALDDDADRCMGKDCIFWCWVDEKEQEEHSFGYCGVAGRPQS